MRTHTYWTTGEIEDLKYLKTVEKLSNKEIASILRRTEISIITQSKYYKVLKFERWSEQSDELLEKLIFNTHYKIEQIAKKLGKTEYVTKSRMVKNFGSTSLQKLRNKSFLNKAETKFTKTEIEFLKKFYYEKGVKRCSNILKRTKQSIKNKVLELKKRGNKFEKQSIPRFNPGTKGYVIYSNKTGKIIKRYRNLEEWARE